MDVSAAFLNADIDPDHLVIVEPPKAWVRMGLCKQGEYWTVRKAIYGVRQSPRYWGGAGLGWPG